MLQWSGMRSLTAGVCVVALAAGLAACGGDDDDDDAASEGASDTCDTYVDIDTAINALFETEDPADAQAAYDETGMAAMLDELEANAPEEIASDVEEAVAAIRQLGEEGDPSAMETFDPAPIDTYYYDNCDGEKTEVTAGEYVFEGMPEELASGLNWIKFENGGGELHEMVMFRINEGTTQSVEELLAMSEEESAEFVTFVDATGAAPGDTAYIVTELEPGDYAAACFIPQGTTSEEEEGDGPPHFMEGMLAEFTVS